MAGVAAGAGTRTLISSVQLNRRRGRIMYRIVLTAVVVVFTLAFIGPQYFLFTDGLKSTQEAIATPPTLYPHHAYPGNYLAAWNRLDVARMLWNTVYYAFGALAFQLVFDVAAAKHRPQLGQRVGGGDVEDELERQRAEGVVHRVPQHQPDVEPVPRLHVAAWADVMRVERRRCRDRFLR